MDFLAKLIRRPARAMPRERDGAALATALFALTAAALLTAGVHWMTRVDIRTTTNRESATRALTIAEAGVSHALAIMRDTLGELSYTQFLRGPDGIGNTSDDGLLTGRTLSSGTAGNDIPAGGRGYAGGRYTVRIVDDPAEIDLNPMVDQNNKVVVQCAGFGPDGAKANLEVIVGGITFPGFVFDGPLTISGTPVKTVGRCGGIHANGAINITGSITASGTVSSSSTVVGLVVNEAGVPVVPAQNQPVVDIPPVDLPKLCDGARYYFRSDGAVFDRTISSTVSIGNTTTEVVIGFSRFAAPPATEWKWAGAGDVDGSMCFDGNVTVAGEVGTAASPRRWSIYASGSVQISGKPAITSFDADSLLVISGGDVKIAGNPVAGVDNYAGAIYAKHQCQISGNPVIDGNLVCDSDPGQDVTRIKELVTDNQVNGNVDMTYNCNNKSASSRRYMGWMQKSGT
jgi:hypothetical protein